MPNIHRTTLLLMKIGLMVLALCFACAVVLLVLSCLETERLKAEIEKAKQAEVMRGGQVELIPESKMWELAASTGRSYLCSMPAGHQAIAASEEFYVLSVVQHEKGPIVLLQRSGVADKYYLCRMYAKLAAGDIIWWDLMENHKVMYVGERDVVIKNLREAALSVE